MKTPAIPEGKTSAVGHGDSRSTSPFFGTSNPRELRALQALMVRPQPREAIDARAGCSNAPDLVKRLRDSGLSIPCERTPCIDRDGFEVMRGIYYMTDTDRRKLNAWLRKREAARCQA